MTDLCPVSVSSEMLNAVNEDQPATMQDAISLLLKEKEFSDVTFTFPNLPDRIEAHELFLKARSPVFKQLFQMRKSGNVQGKEIEISESTPTRFQEFLQFVYTDKFEVNTAGALDLLHLAQKYKVQPLMIKCEELLKAEIQVEDSVQVFETARRYGRDELVDRAGETMAKSLAYLFEIDALKDAEEGTVHYLLDRDDLCVTDFDLFDYFILKWGKKGEACVDFYAGDECTKTQSLPTANIPLKLCISFQAQIGEKLSSGQKKPAVTGIKVKWPYRRAAGSTTTDTALSLSVFIKSCSGPVTDQNVSIRFQKDLLNCKAYDEDEIPVEPPVELASGVTYLITVEDEYKHYRLLVFDRQVDYKYSGMFSPYELSPEASVDLGGVDLKLKRIRKDNRLSGFQFSTAKYAVNVIRGIKLGLV